MADKKVRKDQDWCDCYEYMKKLLGYGEKIMLPRYVVLRLKGLHKGKFMANKNSESYGEYSFKIILTTMQINSVKIKSRLTSGSFTAENHRINSVMLIIEKGINDVVVRMKKVEKSNIKVENIDVSRQASSVAEYQKKKKKATNSDLW